MKKVCGKITAAIVILTMIFAIPIANKTQSTKANDWVLIWSDEFDDDYLNTDTWSYEIGRGDNGWGNSELQYYTSRPKNIEVKDDLLRISAIKENYAGAYYTSARIISLNKRVFKYGKMEARIKVEGGNQNGVWPAFWMMGNDHPRVGWPRCGELDIMEHSNSHNYVEGTIHWGAAWNNKYSWGSFSNNNYYYYPNYNKGIDDWHTYGVIRDENQIKWYVDDQVYLTADISEGQSSHNYFTKDSFFLLNLALGSVSTGYTNHTAPDSDFEAANMYVDYVRVYSDDSDAVPWTTKAKKTTTVAQSNTTKPAQKKATVKVGKTKINKVIRKKKSLNLKFKKIIGANGYQIRYSDVKNFDGYWEKNTNKTKIKLNKLDRKTKYYIKVRAFKKIGYVKVFGNFSKTKKVKTK